MRKTIWHISGFNSYSLDLGLLSLTVINGSRWEVRLKGASYPYKVGIARYEDDARYDAILAAKSIADEMRLAVYGPAGLI